MFSVNSLSAQCAKQTNLVTASAMAKQGAIETPGANYRRSGRGMSFVTLQSFGSQAESNSIEQKFRALFLARRCNLSHLARLSRVKWIASNCGWSTSKQNRRGRLIGGRASETEGSDLFIPRRSIEGGNLSFFQLSSSPGAMPPHFHPPCRSDT